MEYSKCREAYQRAFRTLHGKLLVVTTSPRETMPDAFVVVVNDQDQRALWRAGLALPSGWRRASAVMARGDCLAAIDRGWPDIAPASVRAGVAADGATCDRLVPQAAAQQGRPRPRAGA